MEKLNIDQFKTYCEVENFKEFLYCEENQKYHNTLSMLKYCILFDNISIYHDAHSTHNGIIMFTSKTTVPRANNLSLHAIKHITLGDCALGKIITIVCASLFKDYKYTFIAR